MRVEIKIQKQAGNEEIELLSKKEVLKMCPALTEKVFGARYRKSDGTINPFFLTHGFAFNAMKNRARISTHSPVKRVADLPVYPMEAFIDGDAIFTTTPTKSGNLVAGGFKTQARKRNLHYDESVEPIEIAGSFGNFQTSFQRA
ncbi:MAG: FAD-dependent oxidoreductase [Candidatus Omnitrophica bacterium]|nr:FAD-dependent oxidoreductase [Candidatus Omnitrophota bacterium]MCM8825813.1 FAD-dependent oxidoreductase [Candidatus Omnitrophota bacterium]